MFAIRARRAPISSHLVRSMSRMPSFNRPSPPPLPADEQREFEELVRAANTPAAASAVADATAAEVRLQAGDELHPDARAPAVPEFIGDVNPRTGERGGPKTEPLKHGDWSFGGRATDF